MNWVTSVVLWVSELEFWGPVAFVAIYVIAAILVAPAFFLTVAAGALFGVWRGSLLVFVGASLGALAVHALASPLSRSGLLKRATRNPRIAAVREAVAGEGVWVMCLLRLSPIIPYSVLNYALAIAGVPFASFAKALPGMIPAIIMYTYYGKVVGDVAALAAGASPPRGPEYYAMIVAGLIAIVVSTTMITNEARRALERIRHQS